MLRIEHTDNYVPCCVHGKIKTNTCRAVVNELDITFPLGPEPSCMGMGVHNSISHAGNPVVQEHGTIGAGKRYAGN